MKWLYKNSIIHNVIAHPVMQCLRCLGAKSLALKLHDSTLPDRSSYYVSHRDKPGSEGRVDVICWVIIVVTVWLGYL